MNQRQQRKLESKKKMIESAGKLFRKHGFAATGVDAVVTDAGLTAGGFYAHFSSKGELLRASLKDSFHQSSQRLMGNLSPDPKEAKKQILARYLSSQHRDQPEIGCPLVTLAAELPRHPELTSELTRGYMEDLLARVEALGLSRVEAVQEISRAVGALLLSRLVSGTALSDEILQANQQETS